MKKQLQNQVKYIIIYARLILKPPSPLGKAFDAKEVK
jgi:hypothetical protein